MGGAKDLMPPRIAEGRFDAKESHAKSAERVALDGDRQRLEPCCRAYGIRSLT